MNKEVCPVCNSPAVSQQAGSITQWISSCSCFYEAQKLTGEKLISVTINFCTLCNKRVTTQNSGSLTQWIFGEGRCNCNKPKIDTKSLETRIDAVEDYLDPGEDLQEKVILDVGDFPYERYSPYEELGKGAVGAVYLCQDQLLNKLVAVKILSQLTDEQLVSFQREAKTSSQLSHPNLLKVLDFGATEDGIPYMVLDYFAGVDLSKYIQDYGPLEQEHVKDLFIQLCSALEYTHARGIFHRDITPGNILINIDGESIDVRLIDFGIAKVKEDLGITTSFNEKTLAGTPAYMAPDTANGLDYDQPSEIYSLGCVMYESLIGKPPFEAPHALQLLNMHMEKEVKYPGTINGQWSHVLSTCLAKKKEERYQSPSKLKKDLDELEIVPWSPATTDANQLNNKSTKKILVASAATAAVIGIVLLATNQFFGQGNSKDGIASNERTEETEFGQAVKWYQEALKRKTKEQLKGAKAVKAFILFSRLAKAGNEKAQLYLANCYLNGLGTKVDQKQAFYWLKKLESTGNSAVIQAMGSMLYDGKGVKQDREKGLTYLTTAFRMGDNKAANTLGLIYYKGIGTEKDYKKALEYFKAAAKENFPASLVSLGTLYYNGHGVTKNLNKAREYFERAANLGHTQALTNLGMMYLRSKGVKQNLPKSFAYYKKAADLGNTYALAMLGDFYYFGWSVKRDYDVAYDCYKKAADKNQRYGFYGLAWCHHDGNGAKKDLLLAEKLYKRAIAMGELGAKKRLKQVQEEIKKANLKTR